MVLDENLRRELYQDGEKLPIVSAKELRQLGEMDDIKSCVLRNPV